MLTAGEKGRWTLAVTVDGVRHEFTGKHVSVVGWEYTIDINNDGATASGPLAGYQSAP